MSKLDYVSVKCNNITMNDSNKRENISYEENFQVFNCSFQLDVLRN